MYIVVGHLGRPFLRSVQSIQDVKKLLNILDRNWSICNNLSELPKLITMGHFFFLHYRTEPLDDIWTICLYRWTRKLCPLCMRIARHVLVYGITHSLYTFGWHAHCDDIFSSIMPNCIVSWSICNRIFGKVKSIINCKWTA